MRLPKELKKKWVEALRSGKYRQGIGHLYHPQTNSYCCLGVLEHVGLGEVALGGIPAPEVYKELGITLDCSDEQEATLIRMNDEKGMSFKQIAAYIQRYIKTTD